MSVSRANKVEIRLSPKLIWALISNLSSCTFFSNCSDSARSNFSAQTCRPVRISHTLISDKIPLDRWSIGKLCPWAGTRGNNLQHSALLISPSLGPETFYRPQPIPENSNVASNARHLFSDGLALFGYSRASPLGWSAGYRWMLRVSAFEPLRCAATPSWLVCSIGPSAPDTCGSARRCKSPNTQCHLEAAPANWNSDLERAENNTYFQHFQQIVGRCQWSGRDDTQWDTE